MSAEWRELTLGEFVRLQRGHDLTTNEQRPGVVPVMGSAGQNGTHAESKALGPGVVIGRSGASMGRVHYCAVDYWPHNTCLYVTDFLGNNPLFAYYKLQELDLARYNSGSAQPSLNRNYIYGMRLSVPGRGTQDKIANTISAFDEKIDLNRRINQTLEAMAQAIFKSWFVDFDPVKAKIAAKREGRDPLRAAMSAISGKPDAELDTLPREQFDQLAATAALFPDEMEESELGEIPKGWAYTALSDIADIVMGQSPDGESYNDSGDGMALINGPVEFDPYHPRRIKWTTQPTKTSEAGDLIVCVRGSTTGKFVKSDGIYCLGRGVCAIRARNLSWQPFLDQTYKFSVTTLLSLATGSTFPNWSGPTLKNYRVLHPKSDLIAAFSLLVKPSISQISANENELKTLSSLRDALLPKLLSGELNVGTLVETAGAA